MPVPELRAKSRRARFGQDLNMQGLNVQSLSVQSLSVKGFDVKGFDVTGQWNISAVLLDMDGTLLDTERVYFDSLVAALQAHGYTDDTVTLCQAMVGLPGPDCEAMLHARYGEAFRSRTSAGLSSPIAMKF